ncbi:c-type cytochrome biogenesis protein CcmI [soil metagenome]
MLFWLLAALVTLGSLLVVLSPLLRGAGPSAPRASYDVQIHRDQLREVDLDLRRGNLTPDEARDTAVELSRRLLASADAERAGTTAGSAPRRLSYGAGVVLAVLALGITAALYGGIGTPGYPDQPLGERLARQAAERAARPGQDEVEAILAAENAMAPPEGRAEDAALVERLQSLLETRPDDLEGHRLLARSLAGLGRFADARRAQERIVAILGEAAAADDHATLAELMIFAASGYVSPEAEAALARALALDPVHAGARYFSGAALLQGGRPDLAYPLWSGLLEEGQPDAPWILAIEAEIDEVRRLAGVPPSTGALPPLAPGVEMPPPGAGMIPEEQQVMVEGMVAGLGARLAAEGGPPQDWAQLIRSLGALGRTGEAAAIWAEARTVFADDGGALAGLADAARAAGIAR